LGVVTRSTDKWEWPDSLDAVVAAPDHHSVLLENDQVRVLEARVEGGDTVPVHVHRWPAVQYIVSFADFVRRDADGKLLTDSRAIDLPRGKPFVLWSEPVAPHTLENVGVELIHVIVVELKSPPSLREHHSCTLAQRAIPSRLRAFGKTLLPIMAALGSDPGQPQVSAVHNIIKG